MKKIITCLIIILSVQFAWILQAKTDKYPSYEVIVEPDSGSKPFVDLINNAKNRVWLSIFEIYSGLDSGTCQDITTALAQANNRKVDVQLLLDNGNENFPSGIHNVRILEQQWCENNNIPYTFSSSKFWYFHNKYMIIDDDTAIVMTGNLTDNDVPSDNKNGTFSRNFYVIIKGDKDLCSDLEELFNTDTLNALNNTAKLPSSLKSKDLIITNPNSVTPDETSKNIETIVDFINGTTKNLDIYMMYFNDSCPEEITDAIVGVANNGLPVRIILSNTQSDTATVYDELKNTENIQTVIVNSTSPSPFPFIHTKVFLVDKKSVIFGSINMSYSAFYGNREVDMKSSDYNIVNPIQNTFNKDWEQFTSSH